MPRTAVAANPDAGPFPCEACGHPLNLHDPCSATQGKKPCPCQTFQPQEQKRRVALLTDVR